MTCRNCIHESVCEKLCPRGLLPYQSSEYPAELFCLEFKNKADIVEVKHGYWKWETKIESQAENRLYCSICNNECLGKNNYYVKSEYCPHCFARMDGTPKERSGDK